MDYRVDWAMLRQAVDRLDVLTEGVTSAAHTMRTDRIADALPGSLSAGRAAALDGELTAAGEAMGRALQTHAETMTETADAYERHELRAEAAVGQCFGGLR